MAVKFYFQLNGMELSQKTETIIYLKPFVLRHFWQDIDFNALQGNFLAFLMFKTADGEKIRFQNV